MYLPWGTPTFHVSDMIGKSFNKVENIGGHDLVFTDDGGGRYVFHHYQGCCESVEIEDIVGDLSDLIGSPLLEADVVSNSGALKDGYGSYTWTFYKFGTIKGHVNVRWYGESNGYYSEEVDQNFLKANQADE